MHITPVQPAHKARLKEIYTQAFPASERAPFSWLEAKAEKHKAIFLSIMQGEDITGLVYLVDASAQAYLFYLALAPEYRGKGYGSQVLTELKAMYPDKVLFLARERLEEEGQIPDNLEERIRRKAFYEKNGFQDMPFQITEGGIHFDVMAANGTPKPTVYLAMMENWLEAPLDPDWINMEPVTAA